MNSVTQLDIAKALGISQTTVGLVVGSSRKKNAISKLSPETVERIRAKAEEMGYRPHRHAQVMRTGRSVQVGIIYSQTHLQVASERLSSLVAALRERHYDATFYQANWHRCDIQEAIPYLMDAKVAGIIMLANYEAPAEMEYIKTVSLPIVGLASSRMDGRAQVRSDMRDGMLKIFRHLVEQGYRRIALVSANNGEMNPLTEWGWQHAGQAFGFQEGAKEANWDFEVISAVDYSKWARRTRGSCTASVVLCSTAEIVERRNSPFNPYESPALFAKLLLSSGEALPDAIVFPNDEWAYGFACEAMRKGIRIPNDLAIAGFNDSSLGQAFTIPFTSVRQPTTEMATKAVDLLMCEIQGDHSQRHVHSVPCELVIRESSLRPVRDH